MPYMLTDPFTGEKVEILDRQLVSIRTGAGERLFFEGDQQRRSEFFILT